MSDVPGHDQRPEVWSGIAPDYHTEFARFTGVYVDEVLDHLEVGPRTALLDVATGSGAVALRAAARGAAVTAVDFAPGMVDLVRRRAADADLVVEAQVMDGQALEVADASFDAGVSMFGLIFFPDVAAGAAELRRSTRPGGRVAVGTWPTETFPLVELVGAALAAVLPGFTAPPSPVWARLGSEESLRALLEAAGLVDVATHVLTRTWPMDDPADFFRKLPIWSPPVQPLFEALDPTVIDDAAEAFAAGVVARGDDGLVVDARIGTGRVP